MKFSTPNKFSGIVKFSKDNKYVAFNKGFDVLIYQISNLELLNTFTYIDEPKKIEWSFNNAFVMVGLYDRSIVELSLINNNNNNNKLCKIDEGYNGIVYSFLSPLSSKLFIVNEFNLAIKVYDLTNKNIQYLCNLKEGSPEERIKYSLSKELIAFNHRIESTDIISIYKISSNKNNQLNELNNKNNKLIIEEIDLLCRFEVNSSVITDCNSLDFTKDECFILLFDRNIYCNIGIYNILGKLIKHINPYKHKLGIKNYDLSKSYLAVGFYDNIIRIYHTTSWCLINELNSDDLKIDLNNHKNKINDVVAFVESNKGFQSVYELKEDCIVDFKVNKEYLLKNDILKCKGINYISFSSNGIYLASVKAKSPNVVNIYKAPNFELYLVVVQLNNISSLNFIKISDYSKQYNLSSEEEDKQSILAITTSNKNIYLVTPNEAYVCPIPLSKKEVIQIEGVKWGSKENNLICWDKEYFFLSQMVESEENIEEVSDEDNEDNEDY